MHPGLQDDRETPKRSSGRTQLSGYESSERARFDINSRDPSTKLINGHRDLGATKLPDI
jgi:hypothetical protein